MKNLITLCLVLTSGFCFAQQIKTSSSIISVAEAPRSEHKSPKENFIQYHLNTLTKKLKLNSKQQKDLSNVLSSELNSKEFEDFVKLIETTDSTINQFNVVSYISE